MEEILDADHLIALVEAHPVIWDKTREEHRERARMRDAWITICGQLRQDFDSLPLSEKMVFVNAAVKRWRNIRDQWLKWKNKHLNPLKYKPTHRAYRRKYVYHNQLQFLENVENAPATVFEHTEMSQEEFFGQFIGNESQVDQPELPLRIKSSASPRSDRGHDEAEIEQDFFAGGELLSDPVDPLCKKRKLSSDPEDQNEEQRHMMFFRSVIPYLKAFSERQILDFQMGVLQLVRSSMEPDPLATDQSS